MEVEIEWDEKVHLECYRHLLEDKDVDIDFIYGSRDSGKSHDTALRLVRKCLEADYFRHILCRKTFNTIKDSQWQLIKDIVDQYDLGELFDFKINPLEIHCVNGNKFIARGFDDPQKIKSLQNPSGAWVEEGNQLSKDDWVTLITSLRSNNTRVKIDVTFNPEADGDYRQYWLYKDYFSHTDLLSFKGQKSIEIGGKSFPINYRATHTTYQNNPFCSPQRIAFYEDLKNTSPYYYRIYALGLWGNRENKAPFILTFKRDKHLRKTERDFNLPIYLSYDFNRNPMCTQVIQWDNAKKVDWLESIKLPNSTIYTVNDLILLKYPNAFFIVNGDSTGRNRSALAREQDLDNYYKIIQKQLGLSSKQMQIHQNPTIENSRVLCNYCFHHLDISINPDTCQPFIFDLENAEILANGQLRKADREDVAQQLDSLDGGRYFFHANFRHLIKNR